MPVDTRLAVDTRLTYEDYCLLPDDGKRYEVIEGELYVTPAPFWPHQNVVTNLASYLKDYVRKRGTGKVTVAPFDVVFSQYDVVEPDLLYISAERASILTHKNVQGAPDLVVEVLSESTAGRDRTAKLKLYARHGVAEYWMIDPEECTAEVYRQGQNGFKLAATLGPDDPLESPLLPGFRLILGKLIE